MEPVTFTTFWDAIQGGGSALTYAIIYLLWRIDKRLTLVEKDTAEMSRDIDKLLARE